MKKKQKIIAIVGPSASGKSDLAINLAKDINAEVISADSRMIYKGLDIATAKVTQNEMQGIKHHLIDIKNPDEAYSVADFQDEATLLIKDITSRGKNVIIAGGTGLYFRILLEDYNIPRVAPNEEMRAKLEEKDVDSLFEELNKVDSVMAMKIHKNNKVKIIRALEIYYTLGKPMSEVADTKNPEFDTLWIGLNAENRDFLYNRADIRVNKMIENGLIKELKSLLNIYGELPLFKATIGYQELIPYLKSEITFEEAIEKIKLNTRHYIKRQLTWFRTNKNINWFDIQKEFRNELINKIKNFYS